MEIIVSLFFVDHTDDARIGDLLVQNLLGVLHIALVRCLQVVHHVVREVNTLQFGRRKVEGRVGIYDFIVVHLEVVAKCRRLRSVNELFTKTCLFANVCRHHF